MTGARRQRPDQVFDLEMIKRRSFQTVVVLGDRPVKHSSPGDKHTAGLMSRARLHLIDDQLDVGTGDVSYRPLAPVRDILVPQMKFGEIGRASCRERG